MVVLFILAPEKTPQSMVPVEQREPTQVTRRVLLPDLKGRELTGAVSPSDLRTLGGRIENCMKRVFGFIVGDTVIIFGDDESFKDPSGVLGVEPSSFVRRSGEVLVNPKHSAVETNGDVTRLGTSITYSEVNAAVNTTEGEMLTSITKAYNNEQSEEGRRTLFDKGLDVGFTAAAKARSVLSPEDAERLGNVESKIRRGEALTKEEQSIARELFGHSNPEKLDSLIFYKISQFYRSMAEEISTTLKEKGRSSPEFRSIMKRLSEGGAFLNPLNLMAADIMSNPDTYYHQPEALDGITQVYVSEYKRTSNIYMDKAMEDKPGSWEDAVAGIREEKIDIYRKLCGLLGEKPLTEDDVAKAANASVDDVRALHRSEYSEGIKLPDRLEDDFFSKFVSAHLEQQAESKRVSEWLREGWFIREENWEERKRRKEEEVRRETEKEERGEKAKAEGKKWEAYLTAEAVRDEMKMRGEEPPPVDFLAGKIEEERLRRDAETKPRDVFDSGREIAGASKKTAVSGRKST